MSNPATTRGAGASSTTAGIPKRMELFSRAHEMMVRNWESMLTESISADNFSRAFIDADTRYPEAAAANARRDTKGLLTYAMEREFPSLSRVDAQHVVPCLVADVMRNWVSLTREEFGAIALGAGIAARFAELEKKENALKAIGTGGEKLAPLPLPPDDEMRGVIVESKLAYEASLNSELEKVSVCVGGVCVETVESMFIVHPVEGTTCLHPCLPYFLPSPSHPHTHPHPHTAP